jgi:hypothetical protein
MIRFVGETSELVTYSHQLARLPVLWCGARGKCASHVSGGDDMERTFTDNLRNAIAGVMFSVAIVGAGLAIAFS